MAIDSAPLESQIDSNLPDNITRQNKAGVVRYVLKIVVRWVRDAVNGNLTTWLRDSDNQPGGANADGVYRTGLVTFRGGAVARTVTPTNSPMAQVAFGNQSGLQIMGVNGGPAFMEFHLPGNRLDQLGVDTDGLMKLRPWGANAAYPVTVSGLSALLNLTNSVQNRKLVLFDSGNDHQFSGLGINANTLRYQVNDANCSHVFYAGASPVTSTELMRILGTGAVGIGTSSPRKALDVNGEIVSTVRFTLAYDTSMTSPTWHLDNANDLLRIFRQSNITGVGGALFASMTNAGFFGLGVNMGNGTSQLHVKGTTGHQQFRLEVPYTPTGANDPNGQPGQVAWDDTWFYVKTTGGWRRMILNSW